MRDSTKSCQGHQNVATVIRQVTKWNEYILNNLQYEVKKLYRFGLDLFRLVQSKDDNQISLHIYISEDPYYIKEDLTQYLYFICFILRKCNNIGEL